MALLKKRAKGCVLLEESSDEEGEQSVISKRRTSDDLVKKTHNEVERIRREKMNKYLNQLTQLIPACSTSHRKLDRLTILTMAVDHVKALRDEICKKGGRRSFLSDAELNELILEASNKFSIIINSMGQILSVSQTASKVVGHPTDGWCNQSIYTLLHPDDVPVAGSVLKITPPADTLQPNKMTQFKKVSFVGRLQVLFSNVLSSKLKGGTSHMSSKDQSSTECSDKVSPRYVILQFTGIIRYLTGKECEILSLEKEMNLPCYLATAHLQRTRDNLNRPLKEPSNTEFVVHVSPDGKITYCDPRISVVLGYQPQQLLGQVCYEYFHPEDIKKMVELLHTACQCSIPMPNVPYRFLNNEKNWVWLCVKVLRCKNPFSRLDYVICTNVVLSKSELADSNASATSQLQVPDVLCQSFTSLEQSLLSSHGLLESSYHTRAEMEGPHNSQEASGSYKVWPSRYKRGEIQLQSTLPVSWISQPHTNTCVPDRLPPLYQTSIISDLDETFDQWSGQQSTQGQQSQSNISDPAIDVHVSTHTGNSPNTLLYNLLEFDNSLNPFTYPSTHS